MTAAALNDLGSEVPGTPERPMTWEELRKSSANARKRLIHPVSCENIKSAQDLIQDLENCDEIAEVIELVC